jgi:hypothetical protein
MPNLPVRDKPVTDPELRLNDQASGPKMLDRHGNVEQIVKPCSGPVPKRGLSDNNVKPLRDHLVVNPDTIPPELIESNVVIK